jgi:hypothetical protein
VDNAAHIGGLLAGIVLALAVPYMRPDEKHTPMAWRIVQATCLVVIFVSFFSAFRDYNGPRLAVSNLTRRPGSSVVVFSNRIQEADRLLVESFQLVRAALQGRNGNADVNPAIESAEQGIRNVLSTPRIDAESDKYRLRLLDLLTQQRNMLTEYAQSPTKNRAKLRDEEQVVIDQHNQFLSDYSEWWPGFLKEHGYRPANENDQ